MVVELPKIKIGKKIYYVDLRLSQLRNVKNPNDFIDIDKWRGFIMAFKFKKKR